MCDDAGIHIDYGDCRANVIYLMEILKKIGHFSILSKDVGMPVVAFSLKHKILEHYEYEIIDHLRKLGWVITTYTMAPYARQVLLLRVFVRESMSCY